MKRLSTESALRPLVAQFVPLKIDTSTPEFRSWEAEHKSGARGIPIIYVVRADGQKIYAKSGAPRDDGLPKLLRATLEKSGRIYNDAQLRVIYDTKSEFDKQVENKSIASAVQALKALKKIAPAGQLGSYAAELIQFDASVNQLIEQAKSDMRDIQTQLAEEQLDDSVAIELARKTSRLASDFRGFEPLKDDFKVLDQTVKSNDSFAEIASGVDVLEQAKSAKTVSSKKRVLGKLRDLKDNANNDTIKSMASNAFVKLEQSIAPRWRTWTDDTGSFSVKAKLVEIDGDKAILLKEDRAKIVVPLDRLSKKDRKYLKTRDE